ncbi:oligosaccharide flippase family protein [Ferruginibacter sp.]|uniref:oligosaccharide flippase family protein n=1 Tax=Ferruginibacter sp. TaxID=1940288 RepID=UPI00265AE074|nr:oligosaccharide flippase family protein [Ferruginibacter sp.]
MLNTLLVFFINLILVRLLGVAASGSFFYDITVLSFMILVLSWCLESGITYYASRDNNLIAPILIFILPLLMMQGVTGAVLLRYTPLTINSYFALLFIVSNLSIIYFSAFFYAKKWFISLNIISCCINFVTTIALFFLWYAKLLNIVNKNYYQQFYIGSVALLACVLMAAILMSTKGKPGLFAKSLSAAKDVFKYSSIAFLSNVLFFLVVRIDYFFVQQYCSNAALSNYIQVSKIGQLLILVPSIIGSLVFPYSAGNTTVMTVDKVQQLCRAITLIFIPVTFILIVTAYWILPWIFGTGFNQMYTALLLYLPGFFALSIVTVLAAHLGGKKMLKYNLAASFMALVLVVTGDVLLIPTGGINAAAAVSSVGYMACAVYLLWVFKVKFNCNAGPFFSIKRNEINYILKSYLK